MLPFGTLLPMSAHTFSRHQVDRGDALGQGLAERRHLLGRPDTDPQPALRTGGPHEDATVEQPRPDGVPVGERPNSTKFASDSATTSPGCLRNQTTSASRSARSAATEPSSSGAWISAVRATACVTAERW